MKVNKKVAPILSPDGRTLYPPSMFFNYCSNCTEYYYNDCQGIKSTCCYSCGNWERDTGYCLIHGEIPDFHGCCQLFEEVKIFDCINAVVMQTKDKKMYCSLLEPAGCEKCYEMLMSKADK